jgi:hypothetical protein
MSTMKIPSPEEARHYVREMSYADALVAAQLSATAGQTPIRITSLPMVEAFLQPIDEMTAADIHTTVNFVNSRKLAVWVRDAVGDLALSDALDEIASDGRAFGYQVRDIKPLLVERLTQYADVLGISAATPAANGTTEA